MTSDIQEGPLSPAPATQAPAQKLSWREKRWQRRQRRRFAEEVLGWILVPIILIGSYWILNTILEGLGTSIPAIVQGIQTIIGGQL